MNKSQLKLGSVTEKKSNELVFTIVASGRAFLTQDVNPTSIIG
jgi:hypothetical protein